MDLEEPEAEETLEPSDHGCGPCFNSGDSSLSQNRGEEEIMMRDALEGLPEWRSPSGSGDDWGRRSDMQRSQDEQDVADAISKRTRARYSLADMSLDQLETFLQESDEEDYFQNVDDEEEYRKFLAAVQEKVGGLEDNKMEKVIEETESEDEDADFEVEIEEALESDIEESVDGIARKRKRARRPVTREKRRKRECLRAGRAKAPLRPLLPCSKNVLAERTRFLAGSDKRQVPSYCGFTAHQIGQLYCLMHEHVQLLLQVYAMCALEPAMQQMAANIRRMLMELVEKREAVLSWKRSAFPDFCFRPPYIHPSVLEDEVSSFQRLLSETPEAPKNRGGSSSPRVNCSSGSQQSETTVPLDSNPAPLEAITNVQPESMDDVCGFESPLSSSSLFSESSPLDWVPATSGPVRSLLDVAPLALVREFTEVVDHIVQVSDQQQFPDEVAAQKHSRAPLFAVRLQVSAISESACERVKARSSPNIRRTMAAAFVESTKKQTIALVPKDIAAAMERFSSLFNKSLFPHRAPPATVANRLLFTDAEDELLAMGLMTYNNDWKAIQERFLPSKSMHQIFVRQKNRSSAKAPHNSIKAVRRMKSSPLTADEIACIEEALKVYKYDWAKVCHHCVPHRDPATLPRQWRVALGTQKSYKPNVNNKEKRRLHDTRRRQGFAATSHICPSVVFTTAKISDGTVPSEPYEAGSCDDVHRGLGNSQFHSEGILSALCISPAPGHMSSEIPLALDPVHSSSTTSRQVYLVNGERQTDVTSSYSGRLGTRLKSSKRVSPKVCSSALAYNSLPKDNQTVKLAPGLPPLKLPPTVRVLSHSDTAIVGLPRLVHSCNVEAGSKCSTTKFCLGRLAGQRK